MERVIFTNCVGTPSLSPTASNSSTGPAETATAPLTRRLRILELW
jgi:hypothetical protein